MTTTALREQTITVAGKTMFVAEAGDGPPVVMLHGGGPGASGVSNYSRNIEAAQPKVSTSPIRSATSPT